MRFAMVSSTGFATPGRLGALVGAALVCGMTMTTAQAYLINPQAINLTDAKVQAAWNFNAVEVISEVDTRVLDLTDPENSPRQLKYGSRGYFSSTDNPFGLPGAKSTNHQVTDSTFRASVEGVQTISFREAGFAGDNSLTIEGWFKLDSYATSYQQLFELGGGSSSDRMGLRVLTDGRVRIGARNGSKGMTAIDTHTFLTLGEWTHLAYSWDATNGLVRFYKNGVLADEFVNGVGTDATGRAITNLVQSLVSPLSDYTSFLGGDWSGKASDIRISMGMVDPSELGYHYSFIPEPASLVLLSAGLAVLMRRRRIAC